MKRFNQAMVVIMGVAVSTLFAQALESANREPAAAQEKHWGYEDSAETVGPAKWGTLAGDATCSTGKQQAPINLRAGMATPQDLPNLVFAYKPSSLSMTNNGHTEQMTYEAGSSLGRVGTKDTWTLAQFHFHDPSEHTVDGTSYPLEMHLVHLDAAGKPAVVVAVFIQAGKENAALAPAFQSLPAKEGDTVARPGETIDAAALLPADRTFFTYAGSLTTPPCTEGITWYVLKAPIEMSRAQIAAFTKLEHLGHTTGRSRVSVAASCWSIPRRTSRRAVAGVEAMPERPSWTPAPLSPDGVRSFRHQLTVGDDAVDVTKWFPAAYGIPPHVRVCRSRWINLLLLLPLGFVVLISSVAVARVCARTRRSRNSSPGIPGPSCPQSTREPGVSTLGRGAALLQLVPDIFIIQSGIQILGDHPRLYWTRHCTPGREWFRFQKEVPAEGPWTAKQDSVGLPGQIGLPGFRHSIGLARWWHLGVNMLWVLNGLVFYVLLFPPAIGGESCRPVGTCSPMRSRSRFSTCRCSGRRSTDGSRTTASS